jgi:hypothetical protein
MMEELPFAPKFEDAVFAKVRQQLAAHGPEAALDAVMTELTQTGDFKNVFYAMLVRERLALGVSPFPLAPATELPPSSHEAYENAIRTTARHVGGLLLEKGDIAQAYPYFRMIGELEPVRAAIDNLTPGPDDDIYPLVEIAWQQGVSPEKGFDFILDRSGVCSAITMVSSSDWQANPALRDYCVKRLVKALHAQLRERLATDLTSRGTPAAEGESITQILAAHPDLTADDGYHIDTSHLSSVVNLAMQLPACPEVMLATELARYGTMLSANFQGDNDPPFENTYADYLQFLNAIGGMEADAAIEHFTNKLPAAAQEGYSYPAQVVVNLLVKLDRLPQALAVASEYLADQKEGAISCPSVFELARRVKDYATLTRHAQAQGDLVTYLAGLLAARESTVVPKAKPAS